MATIESSIKLRDGMTPILKNVNKALISVNSAFEKLQKVSGKGVKSALNDLNKAQVSLMGVKNKIDNLNSSFNNTSRAGNNFISTLKGIFSAYMLYQGAKGAIGIADELTMTTARLNLMTGSLEETKKVQDQIYASAMRSRAGYLETADAVAKLRLRAGEIFKTSDEAIAFTETLNKMYAIAGASQSEMYSATLQLTQALGSGVLRGEEFRAVFEAAPNVMQAVADYMGLPIGKLREISNEGKISADIVKNAMFKAAEQVDKQFKQIPVTWSQMWRIVKNHTIKATEPILERIRNITKSERFIKFADTVGVAIQKTADFLIVVFDAVSSAVATCFDFIVEHSNIVKDVLGLMVDVLSTVYDWVVNIANFISSNWSKIAPIVWEVVFALTAYKLALGVVFLWTKIVAIAQGVWTFISTAIGIAKIAVLSFTNAQKAATYATLLFNAAWLANPITWIIIGIIAILAILILWIYYTSDSFADACGRIVGAVYATGAFLWNFVAAVWNGILEIVDGVVNAIIGLVEWMINLCIGGFDSLGDKVANILGQMINAVLSLGKALTKVWDAIFGTDATSYLNGLSDKVINWGKNDKAITLERNYASNLLGMNRKEYGKSYDNGYKVGSNWGSKVTDYFSGNDKLTDSFDLSKYMTEITNDALQQTQIPDFNQTMIPTTDSPYSTDIGKALNGGFGDTNDALNRIAGNTDSMASSLSASDEDLSYMRDLAEREAINRYTLTDLKVEQNNNNNFANGVNAQEMLNLLKKILHDGVQSTANGVHF